MKGEALINTDGATAVGNQVCLSTSTAGDGKAQAVGQGIGG
jgi:hypothetical protein